MQHLDEGTIHAWLDGALSADEAARVEGHVTSCERCSGAVAEARGLIAASSRILTALDDVPRVPAARADRRDGLGPGSFPARWRIAAVIAVVAAGGALALVTRPDSTPVVAVESSQESAREVELSAMEVTRPETVSAPNAERPLALRDGARPTGAAIGSATGRANARAESRDRDLASSTPSGSAARGMVHTEVIAAAEPPPAAPARTDDTARLGFDVAAASRITAEVQAPGTQSSVAEKMTGALGARRSAADASARFTEPAAPQANLRGPAAPAVARPLTEERMVEDGRVVVRRVYRVEETLVTLDERAPEQQERLEQRVDRKRESAATADSVRAGINTLRWVDARGAEFTLSGPVTREQLERFRRLLGH